MIAIEHLLRVCTLFECELERLARGALLECVCAIGMRVGRGQDVRAVFHLGVVTNNENAPKK